MTCSADRSTLCHVGRGNVCIWALCPAATPEECELEKMGLFIMDDPINDEQPLSQEHLSLMAEWYTSVRRA